jgi:SAM-dependent methyltransferase
VAPAENSGLPDQSVDLVTVAQALHWFDVTAFYAEAKRVARPGALLAVWNYPRPQLVDAELDRRFFAFYAQVVGPYWPPERRHIEAGYKTLPFPFEEIETPQFGFELNWNLEQLAGYASSWSATARYRSAGRQTLFCRCAIHSPLWLGQQCQRADTHALGLRVGRRASLAESA